MLLKRYVLLEHLAPFFYSFAVIMFLLIVDLILQMLDLILGKGVELAVVLELFLLNTAWMVALAVPMSVLGSTLMATSSSTIPWGWPPSSWATTTPE